MINVNRIQRFRQQMTAKIEDHPAFLAYSFPTPPISLVLCPASLVSLSQPFPHVRPNVGYPDSYTMLLIADCLSEHVQSSQHPFTFAKP